MTTSANDHLAAAVAAAQRVRALPRDDWSADNAAQLVRTWPYLTDAARSVSRRYSLSGPNRVIDRLALVGDLIHDKQQHSWPGDGPANPDLWLAVTALRDAAAAPSGTTVDADTAEQRLVGTVWMASNLVATSVDGYAGHLHRRFGRLDATARDSVVDVDDISRRLLGATQLAATGLRFTRSPASVDGPVVAALAEWDLHAHRALLGTSSTAALAEVAHVQAGNVRHLLDRLDDAAAADVIDDQIFDRVRPALQATVEPWTRLKEAATELSFGSAATPATLGQAAENFQGLLKAADPGKQASVGGVVAGAASGALSLASTSLDLVVDGELRAPARTIARLIRNERNGMSAAVDPVAILRGASIPIPDIGRDLLAEPLNDLTDRSRTLMQATASLDQLYRSPTPAPLPTDPGERYRNLPLPSDNEWARSSSMTRPNDPTR